MIVPGTRINILGPGTSVDILGPGASLDWDLILAWKIFFLTRTVHRSRRRDKVKTTATTTTSVEEFQVHLDIYYI